MCGKPELFRTTGLTMLPQGHIICREVDLGKPQAYILSLHGEDSQKHISVCITNFDDVFVAQLKMEKLTEIKDRLKMDDELKVINVFKTCIRQNKLEYKEEEHEVTFSLCQDDRLYRMPVLLQKLALEERDVHLKPLLYRLTNQVSRHEEVQVPTASKVKSIPISLPQRTAGGSQPKRRGSGMSIVNPSTKRIRFKPGIQFEEG
ncbi:uncharacterized protein [Anabrus simplex]|uniref:uncharacterized protein isoform X2 n=1 Tax=Anabrus simplex TaxID=316456 RepID=UPI0035A38A33